MSKNNITMHYLDFHPTEQTKGFIEGVLSEIYLELPKGARLRATFCKVNEVMKGMLQINSYGGPFFAVAVADNLNEVTLKLLSQMRRRIEKFKSRRHSRDGIKKLAHEPSVA